MAISDLHVDYDENARWVSSVSTDEYRHDVLILAGDVSHSLSVLEWTLSALAQRFAKVVYVPGNHDLWVAGGSGGTGTSLDKFEQIRAIARRCDVSMAAYHAGLVSIVPLLGWYDYSFAAPTTDLRLRWADYRACRWPPGFDVVDVTAYFTRLNEPALATRNETVISFSHFLPRIDVMPAGIPSGRRVLYPVLGTWRLEEQVRRLGPAIHVYGHSHLNRRVTLDGISYVNNAFGYPSEASITSKHLVCVHDEWYSSPASATV